MLQNYATISLYITHKNVTFCHEGTGVQKGFLISACLLACSLFKHPLLSVMLPPHPRQMAFSTNSETLVHIHASSLSMMQPHWHIRYAIWLYIILVATFNNISVLCLCDLEFKFQNNNLLIPLSLSLYPYLILSCLACNRIYVLFVWFIFPSYHWRFLW